MSKTIELTAENFDKEVLQAGLPVLVDFWAPWCMPCQMMAPILEQIAEEMEGKIVVAKLDVNNPSHEILSQKYQITGIPSLKVFKNGEIVKELVGLRNFEQLKSELGDI
ncbi:MAG TPA: thioredoxin [bacterium]|nr:thioredoxin [bacterium]HPN67648.1 thioredoxin [bacterium]